MQEPDLQSDRRGLHGVEGLQHQVAPAWQDEEADGEPGKPCCPEVFAAHAEHVAEEDVIEMHVAVGRGVEDDAEAEHAREDDAHDRVALDAAVVVDEAYGQRAGHAGAEGPERERQAGHVGQHNARQGRVADRVAHQRPALEHHEAGEERGRWRDKERHEEGLLHEGKLERQEQVHQAPGAAEGSGARAPRRRAAR